MQCMSYIRPHYHGSLKLPTHAYLHAYYAHTTYPGMQASYASYMPKISYYTYLQYLHVQLLSVPCLPSLSLCYESLIYLPCLHGSVQYCFFIVGYKSMLNVSIIALIPTYLYVPMPTTYMYLLCRV